MRLTVIVLTILFFGYSCGQKVPEGVVPQQQMSALLLDMHLADGELASMLVDSARIYRNAYYEAIFNRYAIDSTVFEQSMEFYSTRPALMKKLYITIEKQLESYNMAEQKAVEEKYSAQRKADSIVNARRTDSLRTVTRDSLDLKRKRYLLYLNAPDSLYGNPVPVTHDLLRERMLEAVGLTIPMHNATPRVPQPLPPPVDPKPKIADTPKLLIRPVKKTK